MQKNAWFLGFVTITSAGCAFAMTRAEIEGKLSRPLTPVHGEIGEDSFRALGTDEVVAAGPAAIPILLEIVRENRAGALAWTSTRSDEDGRRLALRLAAIDALGRIMQTPEEAVLIVPVLERIGADSKEPYRVHAIEALAYAGAPGSVDALARLFQQFQSKVDGDRFFVMGMLAATPDPNGREVLSGLSNVDDPLIRKELEILKGAKPWPAPQQRVHAKAGQNCGAVPLGAAGLSPFLILALAARLCWRVRVGDRRSK